MRHPNARIQIAVCALQVQPGDEMVRLFPAGRFDAPRGSMAGQGPWVLTEASARGVIARAAARTVDIVIDYEHQTLLTEQNGLPAPAAGWVDPASLEWRHDGIYGRVRWTKRAGAAIQDDEYRYLSPVFPYDRQTGEVLDLFHVALTNTPAIDELPDAVMQAAARMTMTTHQEEDSVKREELIKVLGLKTDATDEQIQQGIAALKAGADQAVELRQQLDIQDDASPVDAVAALKTKAAAQAPDMKDYVPRTVYEETQQQVAALKAGSETVEVDRLIEEGMKDGRIPGKATADWLRGQGLAALKVHLKDAPGIAALKAQQTAGKAPDGANQKRDGELTQEELAVCKRMGIKPEDYKTANKPA